MKRFLTMCAGILLICQFTPPLTLAQNAGYEVKGVVVDKSGMPILGATVVEKGTTNGVSTGIDGDYAIRAAGPESVIEVSYVGYKTVSLVASSSLLAHLTLEEDAMGIDDVVVIGYGSVKKNDMTGSVVAIKAEEFNRGAVVSTQDMLKGKVPGVHIIPGDGGAWFMQRLIGYQQAFELTLSGRIVGAAEAKTLGIVLEVVEPDQLLARAHDMAARFAAQPPKALPLLPVALE